MKNLLLKKKNIFGMNYDFTDYKYNFDEPNINQLGNIVEEAFTDCIRFFINLRKSSIYSDFCPGTKWRRRNLFYKNDCLKTLYGPIGEQNELYVKIHQEEQEENGFSFDSMAESTKKDTLIWEPLVIV